MTKEEALKWAFESDWGTDWDKDCKAMLCLAEELTRLSADFQKLYEATAKADTAGRLSNGNLFQQTLVKIARELGIKNNLFDYWEKGMQAPSGAVAATQPLHTTEG